MTMTASSEKEKWLLLLKEALGKVLASVDATPYRV
jgi:hypothetical protein